MFEDKKCCVGLKEDGGCVLPHDPDGFTESVQCDQPVQTMTEAELRKILDECLSDEIRKQKGQILYSGIDTLRRGEFYFIGFNPKRDGTNHLLHSERLSRKNWSAYTKQCWFEKHCRCEDDCDCAFKTGCSRIGKHPHQDRVRKIMCDLGREPEEIFATNFIFVESEDVRELKTQPIYPRCLNECWQVHKKILAVVRPRCIVCLGYGEYGSAYRLIRDRASEVIAERESDDRVGNGKKSYAAFKKFVGQFQLDCVEPLNNTTVVGVLHPSYWESPPGLRRFINAE